MVVVKENILFKFINKNQGVQGKSILEVTSVWTKKLPSTILYSSNDR